VNSNKSSKVESERARAALPGIHEQFVPGKPSKVICHYKGSCNSQRVFE
jgi:hypothetical protein